MKAHLGELETEIEEYLVHCSSQGVKRSTIKHSYGYSLLAVLLPWCRSEAITSVAGIDQDTLARFAAFIRNRTKRDGSQLADNTVWTYQKAANQFVKWYAELHNTPRPKVQLHQPPGRKVITLGRDQIALLERTAATECDRVIIRLLADTGMRPGELVSITKGGLRHEGRRNYVRITSNTDGRDVPITAGMYARLRALAGGEDDAPIFIGQRRDRHTGELEALTVPGVRQMVGSVALNAGIAVPVNPYVLRHSACRWLLMSGQSTIVVEMILGHGSDAMIREHYNDLGTGDAHDRLMRVLRAERLQQLTARLRSRAEV